MPPYGATYSLSRMAGPAYNACSFDTTYVDCGGGMSIFTPQTPRTSWYPNDWVLTIVMSTKARKTSVLIIQTLGN